MHFLGLVAWPHIQKTQILVWNAVLWWQSGCISTRRYPLAKSILLKIFTYPRLSRVLHMPVMGYCLMIVLLFILLWSMELSAPQFSCILPRWGDYTEIYLVVSNLSILSFLQLILSFLKLSLIFFIVIIFWLCKV